MKYSFIRNFIHNIRTILPPITVQNIVPSRGPQPVWNLVGRRWNLSQKFVKSLKSWNLWNLLFYRILSDIYVYWITCLFIVLYSYCSCSCRQLYSTRWATRDENNNYHRVLGTGFQSIARSRRLASSYELNSQVNPASRRLCWLGPAAQWHSRLLMAVTSRIRYVSIRDNTL